jgi:1-acyl-sn-glycerol-3-phosphate acyltransferase
MGTFLFKLFFYGSTIFWSLVAILVLPLPRRWGLFPMEMWSRGMQLAIPFFTGVKIRFVGEEHLGDEAVIVACKHASVWETTVFQGYLKDPAIILKKELEDIPVFGWYVKKLKMIRVDRAAGSNALRSMVREAKAAIEANRKLVIYPEGTRVSSATESDYQAGVFALYSLLKIPVVPVGINARLLWPKNSFPSKKGTLYMEFLPPIHPGLDREKFMDRLAGDIEASTRRLEAIAFEPPRDLPPVSPGRSETEGKRP